MAKLKVGDLIAVPGKRRPWYEESYTPLTRGEVASVTKDEIGILWYDTKRVTTYPLDKVKDKDEAKEIKKKYKDDKEYRILSVEKVRK